MSRYTNNDIKLTLSDLRSKIRNGVVVVGYKTTALALRQAVALAFKTDAVTFNTDANFNPQTVRRFEKLFDVPVCDNLAEYKAGAASIVHYPTQDETATALQNFLNRRADPWSHVRPSTETLLAAASVNV